MKRVRVGSLQYYIRPVKSYADFELQIEALIATAIDYRVQILSFSEYFAAQLLTLGDIKRPIAEQIRDLSQQESRIVSSFSRLVKGTGMVVIGGSIPGFNENGEVLNKAYVFGSDGSVDYQPKLHMTRFEKDEWNVVAGSGLKVFDTPHGKLAIAICYDVEFPEICRAAAKSGAQILVVPSNTDDRQGYLRVRYCAQARAIENQMYVIHSPTVGSLPHVPAVSLNYGQAAIYTPSDYEFARDGILAEGAVNQEMMIVADLNLTLLETSRSSGTVRPLLDSSTTESVLKTVKNVEIKF